VTETFAQRSRERWRRNGDRKHRSGTTGVRGSVAGGRCDTEKEVVMTFRRKILVPKKNHSTFGEVNP